MGKFVVSIGTNVAATKAFLDSLRLSKAGDEIHVVYVRPFLENVNSECSNSQDLRQKYGDIISHFGDKGATGALASFGDRDVRLVFAPHGRGETIAQALVRYANNFGADFVVVGTNALRVERGKPILGSVSLQICMEFEGNIVISNYHTERYHTK